VTFLGPHAYISPSWYANPVTVPTWNYAAVHVYGVPVIIDNNEIVRAHLLRLVDVHESNVEPPWDADVARDVITAQVKGVVAFEIPIRRIEGKWKFNQNRSREDQLGVVTALERAPDPESRAVASIMTRNLEAAQAHDPVTTRPVPPPR
jgi:transcriptional regulator